MNATTRYAALAAFFMSIASLAETGVVIDDAELLNLGVEFRRAGPAGNIGAVAARGRVIIPPSSEHVIGSTQPGLILRLHSAAGDPVTRGQVLAEIRSPAFLSLQQEYLEAVHDYVLAAAQLERDRQLVDEGIIAERRFEETRAIAGAAAGRRAEHRQILRLAGMSDPDIEALEKEQRFRDTLSIRSPVDGVVLDLMAKAGESVDAVEALYRVANLTELWIEIHVPQEQIGLVRLGMMVAVSDCLVDLPARVTAIGRAVDANTQTVSVRAELRGTDHGLKPGQLVDVRIVAAEPSAAADDLAAVPVAAVTRSGDKSYVFVRTATGFAAHEVEQVGDSGGEYYIRGLPREAEVAVRGVAALKALWLGTSDPDS